MSVQVLVWVKNLLIITRKFILQLLHKTDTTGSRMQIENTYSNLSYLFWVPRCDVMHCYLTVSLFFLIISYFALKQTSDLQQNLLPSSVLEQNLFCSSPCNAVIGTLGGTLDPALFSSSFLPFFPHSSSHCCFNCCREMGCVCSLLSW